MEYKLTVKAQAQQEIYDGADYYEGLKEGLGVEFASAVNAQLYNIRSNPLQFPIVYEKANIRHAIVKKFSYKILFRVYDNHVIKVGAIMHSSRNPERWQSRKF